VFTCLDCETNFEIDEDVEPDDIVQCPECESRMVVLSTNPPLLDFAE
jgi:DNA-directed RNA polymerase subunit RPC12/RpoP